MHAACNRDRVVQQVVVGRPVRQPLVAAVAQERKAARSIQRELRRQRGVDQRVETAARVCMCERCRQRMKLPG